MKDPLDLDRTTDIEEFLKNNKSQAVGYIRVSSIDQNTDRQLDGLSLDRVFIDKITGSTKERPQLQQMLDYVRYGDMVIVHSLDRLARNFDDLLAIIKELNQKGVSFKSLQENITINATGNSPMDLLILHIFGAIAQFNRSLIREAQREGIAKAKARGVYKGRKPSLTSEKQAVIERRLAQKEKDLQSYKAISYQSIADEVGVSLATLNRYLVKRKKVN
ncbi:recombinase family protein [Moraxella nonliquefaciens]|uniref:Resolvase/invertase-type recombinase catalytic domain-containing protein n=1 Tax=Moraxella nonliquefaciens TaxID=478 RepID=A0A1B8PIN8_MORNO|nr:recombinase family protein [Moraxella nonliquefaciens]OBX49649.1 hypothetical protein A9Z60_03190 [Moraxella nonliquefaciens]